MLPMLSLFEKNDSLYFGMTTAAIDNKLLSLAVV